MSAAFKSGSDTEVIEAHEFEYDPPCELTKQLSGVCGRAADWIVTFKHHCVPDVIRSLAVCDGHLPEFRSTGWMCRTCGLKNTDMPARIIRTERINP